MSRRSPHGLLLALSLAGAGPALAADEEMTCGSAAVRQRLQDLAVERLCLDDNLRLADAVWSLAYESGALTLADLITLQVTEIPMARSCEAQLAFELTLASEALGPGPGLALRLRASGDPRTVTYTVGRFDDGRLYVRPAAGCWRIDRLAPLD
jgi:hypothetical protein